MVTPSEQKMARQLQLTDWDLEFVYQMMINHNTENHPDPSMSNDLFPAYLSHNFVFQN